jgi:hypothetical protein
MLVVKCNINNMIPTASHLVGTSVNRKATEKMDIWVAQETLY